MVDDPFHRFGKTASPPTAAPTAAPAPALFRSGAGAGVLTEGEILSLIERIPSMPVIVTQLLTKVGNASANSGDLEELIKQDLAIAGRLLKLVNSPFFGLGHQVASISEAVQIVGYSSLKCLVIAASAANILAVDLASYGFSDRGLWRNAVATASVARAIGLKAKASPSESEAYFAAGLLRDIGMLVLGPVLTQRQQRLSATPAGKEHDIQAREREVLGFDHGWVGARAAEKWGLPANLKLCIVHHHRIPATTTIEELRLLATVRLAERLVYATGVGVLKDHPFDARLEPILIQASGLGAERFEGLIKELPQIIKAAEMTG